VRQGQGRYRVRLDGLLSILDRRFLRLVDHEHLNRSLILNRSIGRFCNIAWNCSLVMAGGTLAVTS
jgi:hypothetical protein